MALWGAVLRNYFEFRPVVQEISFYDNSYPELWWPSCFAVQPHLRNIDKGQYEVDFCEIIFDFGPVVQEQMRSKIFLIYSSSGHLVRRNGTIWQFLANGTPFCNQFQPQKPILFNPNQD